MFLAGCASFPEALNVNTVQTPWIYSTNSASSAPGAVSLGVRWDNAGDYNLILESLYIYLKAPGQSNFFSYTSFSGLYHTSMDQIVSLSGLSTGSYQVKMLARLTNGHVSDFSNTVGVYIY
jgi:hypothetical protein